MVIYSSRFLRHGECWFEPEVPQVALDWVHYLQVPTAVPRSYAVPFTTLVIALDHPMEGIFGGLSSSTRADVRRAKSEGVTFQAVPEPSVAELAAFREFYTAFAELKHLPPVDLELLEQRRAAKTLMLFSVRNAAGEPIGFHSFIRGKNRIRGHLGASFFRKEAEGATRRYIGRANRLLVWSEMEWAHAQGFREFDQGGWYAGTEDKERLRINQFKAPFGGQVVREYNCMLPIRPAIRLVVKPSDRLHDPL